MGERGSTLSFSTPPVRSVRLAFYFETAERLTAAHTSALFELWRPEYPEIVQSPPRAPVTEPTQDIGFIGQDDYWPLPFTEMENPDSGKSIFFQDDRFGVLWNFDPDLDRAPAYPGFDELRKELLARFERFCDAVKSSGGSEVRVQIAECTYTNEMPDVAIDQYAFGILTHWAQGYESAPSVREGTMFSRHYHFEGDPDRPVWVSASAAGPDTGMTLRITTRHEAEEELSPVAGIEAAHEDLITTFVQWSSDEMRQGWGQQ